MNGINSYFQQGMTFREQRRLKQAVVAFQKALKREPDNGVIWFQLGMTHDNRGEEEAAIPCYLNAIGLGIEPADAVRANLYLSSSYLKTGHVALAQIALEKAEQGGCSIEQITRMKRRINRAATKMHLMHQHGSRGNNPA